MLYQRQRTDKDSFSCHWTTHQWLVCLANISLWNASSHPLMCQCSHPCSCERTSSPYQWLLGGCSVASYTDALHLYLYLIHGNMFIFILWPFVYSSRKTDMLPGEIFSTDPLLFLFCFFFSVKVKLVFLQRSFSQADWLLLGLLQVNNGVQNHCLT